MDESIYLNTVVPLKSNDAVGTVAITTPSNDMNWFSYLQELKDSDGRMVFKTFYKGTACTRCTRRNKADTCEHKQMPNWKSKRGIDTVKAILEKNKAIWNKEIQGIQTTDQVKIYERYVPGFLKLDLYVFKTHVSLSFSFIDRGAGTSDTAIVTIASEGDNDVIVAGDTINSTDDREINKMLVRHFVRLNKLREFSQTIKVVATEINFGGPNVGLNVQRLLTPDDDDPFDRQILENYSEGQSLGKIFIASKDTEQNQMPGVWTGEAQKEGGAHYLKRCLQNKHLRYAKIFQSENQNEFKTKMRDQLSFFRDNIKEAKDPVFQAPKHKFSGKGPNKNDDVVTCLLLSLYWKEYLTKDRHFRRYCRENGVAI